MNSAQSNRTIRKREQRRQSLIDAAKQLFVSQGYSGTTIDDIAEKADVAKVTFYYHFKSKEEIALEIKRRETEEALAYIESLRASDLPVDGMINAFINDVVEWTEENWRLLEMFCAQRFSPLLERETTTECKPYPLHGHHYRKGPESRQIQERYRPLQNCSPHRFGYIMRATSLGTFR